MIAGPNGAGKTTFATEFLPDFVTCREFLNADLIRRRFAAGIRNLFALYRPLVDDWLLYDASRLPPRLIGSEKDHKVKIVDSALCEQILPKTQE